MNTDDNKIPLQMGTSPTEGYCFPVYGMDKFPDEYEHTIENRALEVWNRLKERLK